jgi:lysophospholipase L1-like esterase
MEGVQLADTADLARARIVTMTVGANDIGFSPTGKVCTPEPVNHRVGGSPAGRTTSAERRGTDGAARVEVTRTQPEVNACTRASTVHAAEVSPARFAHLAQTLEATYAAVKAAAPGAALYIVGYPYLVPTRPSARIARIGCDGIPGPELASLAKLEVGMDGAAKAAAKAEGAIYVDPNAGAPVSFAGHDVCSARGVWFNALMKVKQFSYHPNATGQVKLFEDLRASIEAHGLAPRAVRR